MFYCRFYTLDLAQVIYISLIPRNIILVSKTSGTTIMWKHQSTSCLNSNKSFVSTILGPGKAIGQVHLPPGVFSGTAFSIIFCRKSQLTKLNGAV
jgi:hypothetical protein